MTDTAKGQIMSKPRFYSWATQDAIERELPQRVKDAFSSTGWNAFGVYELVEKILAQEKANANSSNSVAHQNGLNGQPGVLNSES